MKNITNLIKNTYRAMKLSFKFSGWITLFLVICTTTVSLLPVWQAKIMGDLVNRVVENLKNNADNAMLVNIVALYATLWAFTRIVMALRGYANKLWVSYTEEGLEVTVMRKRTEIDLGHYESPDFQNLLQRAFKNGIWPVFNLLETQMSIFGNIAVFIITSLIATQLSPMIYFIVITTSIPMFVVNLKYGSKMWTINNENSPRQRKYQHIRSHINGRIGVTQTKLFQASKRLIDAAEEILSSFRKETLKVDRMNFIWSAIASVIAAVGVGVSFYMIILKVSGGQGGVGSMVFLVSVLGQLVGSISSILTDVAKQFERNLYATDIFAVLDTKPYIKRKKKSISLHLSKAPKIEFKDVWFKYEGREDWILQNINLVIKPGEKIALVGENGAGKSTLIKLLSRIYDPTRGEILVDGFNLKNIDLDEWNSYLAVLLQDYVSYDFSVNESIAMGRSDSDVDYEKVKSATALTGAHEFIGTWEFGFDQQLGKEFDGGIEPSKGQQQKIALSRVIYREGLVVILDEPTAAIDAMAEMYIFEQMEKAAKGKTLIMITHRFNTTQSVDTIVVLEKGTIVEKGSHNKLLATGGFYAEMFESQAKAFRQSDISNV